MDFQIPDLTRTHTPEQLSKARAKPERRALGPLPKREGVPGEQREGQPQRHHARDSARDASVGWWLGGAAWKPLRPSKVLQK